MAKEEGIMIGVCQNCGQEAETWNWAGTYDALSIARNQSLIQQWCRPCMRDAQMAYLRKVTAHAWQPIETAPKITRKEILLCGVWVHSGEWFFDVGHWNDYEDGFWDWGGDDSQPSHWMPLPDPPASCGATE